MSRYATAAGISLVCTLWLAGCGEGRQAPPAGPGAPTDVAPAAVLTLTSTAFEQGDPIPAKYTADGDDASPPLAWSDPPVAAQSFALVVDDPDAPVGTWVHWVLYNIPATARSLPEGVAPDAELADGSRNGTNSWGRSGYGGPSPPSGTHRYVFKLYALNITLDVPAGATKENVLKAAKNHVVAEAELMGTYSRNR